LILCYTNEYLNPWYILAETGTGRHVITMHHGNGDKPNKLINTNVTYSEVFSFETVLRQIDALQRLEKAAVTAQCLTQSTRCLASNATARQIETSHR